MLATPLGRFRLISLLEGISYILLLAIAMPLKYMAGNTLAVPWAGRIHGALFVIYVVLLAAATRAQRWSLTKSATAMISSLIPLGAFWLESRLRREPPSSSS